MVAANGNASFLRSRSSSELASSFDQKISPTFRRAARGGGGTGDGGDGLEGRLIARRARDPRGVLLARGVRRRRAAARALTAEETDEEADDAVGVQALLAAQAVHSAMVALTAGAQPTDPREVKEEEGGNRNHAIPTSAVTHLYEYDERRRFFITLIITAKRVTGYTCKTKRSYRTSTCIV